MAIDTIDIARLGGGRLRLTGALLDDLRARLAGPVLQPGDPGWDDAVQVWNAMAAHTPALVVQPTSARDVSATVGFARDNGLLMSVKGGGHNIAGTSIAEGGLALDMSRMRAVTVDSDARLAHVEPGCLLSDVDRATQQHGLATVLGIMSEVGVAGLTLGGGFGYLARRYGWAVDNLEKVEIVTADGTVRTTSRDHDADLFWALRGGGGNLGVVTRFTFRLHPVGPTVTGGLLVWDAARADDVLAAYRLLTSTAPRELTAGLIVRLAPPAPFVPLAWHGKPVVGVLICHTGPHPEADLAPLRALGEPIVDLLGERPYVEQQAILDEMDPKGLNQYWKTEYLPGLSDGFLAAFRGAALRLTSPLSYSILFHLGGAVNDHADDDGAVGNRDARFIVGFSAVWPPGLPDAEHVGWARASWQAIRPFSTGGNYVNFQLAEDDATRTAAAYGANFARLRQVKADCDGDNLFRVNRNISPAARRG